MYCIFGIQAIKKNGTTSATQAARAQIYHDFRLGESDYADETKLEDNKVLCLNEDLLTLPNGEKYEPFRYDSHEKTPDVNFAEVFRKHIAEHCRSGYKVRSNAIYALEIMMTTSSNRPEGFDETGWVKDSLKWCEDKFGKENIVFAVLHKDETVPHIHVQLIPIVNGTLCASKYTGKMEKNRELNKSYYEAVKKYGFKRRDRPIHKKKIPISVFRERLREELDKESPEPKQNETAVEYCQRIKDWLDNRKAEMFFDVNKERGELREEWTRALAREVDLDRREIRLAASEVKIKAQEAELAKYKPDHDCMEAIREMERRMYITKTELSTIQRIIEMGKKLLREMADRVFHPRNDTWEPETPQDRSPQTDYYDLER